MTSPRDFARSLRKTPSRAERALWDLLRNRRVGVKFRRQHPIAPYTADFACVEARLIVEVDGSSHDVNEQSRTTKAGAHFSLKPAGAFYVCAMSMCSQNLKACPIRSSKCSETLSPVSGERAG